jgi:hypothetical protein
MQLRVVTFTGLFLLCSLAAASQPWNILDGQLASTRDQKIQCNPMNKLMMRQMRPLLRKLFLSTVSLQICREEASKDICSLPHLNFQRHHHCRLLTLSQHSAQSCTDTLLCKQPTTPTCSSTWKSNIAALQWLFPRHAYCGDKKIHKVSARCDKHFLFQRCKDFTHLVQFPIIPVVALRKIAGGDKLHKELKLSGEMTLFQTCWKRALEMIQ